MGGVVPLSGQPARHGAGGSKGCQADIRQQQHTMARSAARALPAALNSMCMAMSIGDGWENNKWFVRMVECGPHAVGVPVECSHRAPLRGGFAQGGRTESRAGSRVVVRAAVMREWGRSEEPEPS